MTRIIGVISGKGGVGKTTTVANLGSALASKYKKSVIIVDANITTSHLGLYLGMYYCPITLNHVLSGHVDIEEALYDYHVPGLRVIPSSLSFKDLKGADIARLKHVLKKLFGKADIILLDSAPGLGREAMATIQASDEVLFVTTPFIPATMDIIKCNEVVKETETKTLGVVMNMVGKEKYELTSNEVEQLVEIPTISVIPMDKEVLKSLALKMPVVLYNPRASSSRAYVKLAGHIIGEQMPAENAFAMLMRILGLGPKKENK